MLEEKVDIQLFEEPNELFTLFIIAPITIVTTFINLYMFATGKVYMLAMAMRLSFTALTLCAKHNHVSNWGKVEDWAALLDVVPTLEKA